MNIEVALLGKKLIIWGVVLFLIGLIQGAFIPLFQNPRMALSAHLAAVQSGMAMAIFGLIWAMVSLNEVLQKLAYYANVLGMYLVWLGITLAAILGASLVLPIAGEGFSASATMEMLVGAIIMSGSLALLVSVSIITIGLLKVSKSN